MKVILFSGIGFLGNWQTLFSLPHIKITKFVIE